RLRGTAAAAFVLGSTMIGLGLGPYAAGKLSVLLGDLGLGLLAILAVAPLVIALFWLAYDDLREKAV
ncbi:MAG TPA: MFS transporter, partial [Novosphingobium sp.]